MQTRTIAIAVSSSQGEVSAEIIWKSDMKYLFVFAHGAGAGMKHPFMERLAHTLANHGIGTLRYNFPYMEQGKKRPDPPAIAELTVKRAVETAREMFPDTPLLAGGKSFGGRMTSQATSRDSSMPLRGLIFVGFPLHAMGKPSMDRAKHLSDVRIPMLFLQGTRDALADFGLIKKLCTGLSAATLISFDGADHSFRSGKKDLIPALAEGITNWAQALE